MVVAKKSLGQNFLIDGNYQRKIIQSVLELKPHTLLEIGPGQGALTQHFIHQGFKVIVVEKDKQLAGLLQDNWGENLQVIEGDFLIIDLKKLPPHNIHVVGNLPYNVSSQILIRLLENHKQFDHLNLMFQKEVALRCTAKPATKDYGLLSLWSQIYTEPTLLFHLPPTAFKPQPKVSSSMIHFKMRPIPLIQDSQAQNFWTLMRKIFQQRRKTLRHVLVKEGYTKEFLANHIADNLRAETLSPNELISLFNKLVNIHDDH